MFSALKFLLKTAFALLVVVPVAILFAVIGLPVLVVLGVLALPILLVLFVAGLPVLLLMLVVGLVVAVVVGVAGAMFGVAIGMFKLAVFVMLPIALVVWAVKRLVGGRRPDYV